MQSIENEFINPGYDVGVLVEIVYVVLIDRQR